MKSLKIRKKHVNFGAFSFVSAFLIGFLFLLITLCSLDSQQNQEIPQSNVRIRLVGKGEFKSADQDLYTIPPSSPHRCATVEEMGRAFNGGWEKESLRVRRLIRDHFDLHGAGRVRGLPPNQFCRQGFVIGKAAEAGFGNEMYKILTAAALSILLNRSLIIGQTRGRYPFGEYISYTSNSFTLKEVKHLWKKNHCLDKYNRSLVARIDDFERPAQTGVLCSDWGRWRHPLIWLQGAKDATAIQFFLKNVHRGLRDAALQLLGNPGKLNSRPNIFGELIQFIISPSRAVEEAVNWVLNGGPDPDVTVHMRMMTARSPRAAKACIDCIKKALRSCTFGIYRPRVVLVSDTPVFIRDIAKNLSEFAQVVHFDYRSYGGNISRDVENTAYVAPNFRAKDWGPAPRWVTFVDFFLASHAKHAVITGAQRRVGTTYAQLIAALAAANQLDENSSMHPHFSFFSSFQSNLLIDGLCSQVGWGHVWNRFAGTLSCKNQPSQCAVTPLTPSAWWDDTWQSPITRDVRRMHAYGVQLNNFGEVLDSQLQSSCVSRKVAIKTALSSDLS